MKAVFYYSKELQSLMSSFITENKIISRINGVIFNDYCYVKDNIDVHGLSTKWNDSVIVCIAIDLPIDKTNLELDVICDTLTPIISGLNITRETVK